MKKIGTVIASLALFSLLFTFGSFAQMGPMWKGSGGWGMGMQYNRMYNPKTVETITGEVVSVDKITLMKGMSQGVHMELPPVVVQSIIRIFDAMIFCKTCKLIGC